MAAASGRSDGIAIIGMRADESRELVARGGRLGLELLQVHGSQIIDVQIPVIGCGACVRYFGDRHPDVEPPEIGHVQPRPVDPRGHHPRRII